MTLIDANEYAFVAVGGAGLVEERDRGDADAFLTGERFAGEPTENVRQHVEVGHQVPLRIPDDGAPVALWDVDQSGPILGAKERHVDDVRDRKGVLLVGGDHCLLAGS